MTRAGPKPSRAESRPASRPTRSRLTITSAAPKPRAGRVRLVIADRHPIILDGLEVLFSAESDLEVVARCVNGDETLAAVRLHRPDILLLDIHLPGTHGLRVIRRLRQEKKWPSVVVFTDTIDEVEALEALRLGVRGMVLKEQPADTLVRCVRKVHGGEPWLERDAFSRALTTLLEREAGAREVANVLTPRETDVVRMVASGLDNAEVSERLSISRGTVKVHLHQIYRKLKVTNRVELTLYARSKQLV